MPDLESRLKGHVEALAGDIGERHVGRPQALHAAEAYIAGEFAAIGYDVARQTYVAEGVASSNLEVTRPGGPRGSEIVLAGAHYDTVPGSPGADDNASGVAALIEIARVLRETRCERTVKLVAFVNEEPPFFYWGEMGSRVYARAARARGDDIRVMLSLEMLGCYSDAPGSQSYPPLLGFFYPKAGNFIGFVSNLRSRRALREVVRAFRSASDFRAESLASPAIVPGVSWSDQLSFWREGYRAVMVTDTAFYRYPHYHRATDTPDRLDYARMARVVEGLAGALRVLAGGDTAG
ncbi:M20/M25/M40 family metallo-hydrolase [Betaproteobacteria bacterium PRO7]|jgi:Zn-dependent M28 family amino/carboxypeptidase|nr:M20/M25/M40 family metallo-hydrolase [Burkholderiaceae bacterium]MDL1862297.1 M20/M25/M40 family metallo-hydrolase [Betaproteobacteria bacterium PRO7]